MTRRRRAPATGAGPAPQGERPGTPDDIAVTAAWHTLTTLCYGRQETRHAAEIICLWYGSWHTRTARVILIRGEHTASGYDLALVTTGPAACCAPPAARCAARWATEQAFAGARNIPGAGQARNHLPRAVERTVPSGMFVHTLIIIWYLRYGHDPADIDDRRAAQPWYATKTEPAFEDMRIKLRRTLTAARFPASRPGQPEPEQINALPAAWDAAAA